MNAILGLAGMVALAGAAQAATITLDVRVHGTGAKTATIANVGDTVSLDLYVQIANSDNNHANDGVQVVQGGFLSTESATPGGLMGNLAGATFNTGVFAGTGLNQAGTPTNLDSNPDLELGSINGNSQTDWMLANSLSLLAGTGAGSGVTELLVANTLWTATTNTGTTSVSFFLRPATTGTLGQKTVLNFTTDGALQSYQYNDPNIALGSPVVISVPEPTSLSLLGLGSLALLHRRRKAC